MSFNSYHHVVWMILLYSSAMGWQVPKILIIMLNSSCLNWHMTLDGYYSVLSAFTSDHTQRKQLCWCWIYTVSGLIVFPLVLRWWRVKLNQHLLSWWCRLDPNLQKNVSILCRLSNRETIALQASFWWHFLTWIVYGSTWSFCTASFYALLYAWIL